MCFQQTTGELTQTGIKLLFLEILYFNNST